MLVAGLLKKTIMEIPKTVEGMIKVMRIRVDGSLKANRAFINDVQQPTSIISKAPKKANVTD